MERRRMVGGGRGLWECRGGENRALLGIGALSFGNSEPVLADYRFLIVISRKFGGKLRRTCSLPSA